MIEDRERAGAYVTERICTHSSVRLIRDVETGRFNVMSARPRIKLHTACTAVSDHGGIRVAEMAAWPPR